ncbi:MAG: STAS domain-containing protein [Kiritimatiellae bacterium]|nr:STAS domain-containing protein [Kiritimatiellia bacterium]
MTDTPFDPSTSPAPTAEAPTRILAATAENVALVAVSGRASFRLVPAFRQALQAARLSAPTVILVDMAATTAVDSSFMGAIASASQAAGKPEAVPLRFLNIPARILALLKGLGVDRLMRIVPASDEVDLSALVAALAPVEAGPVGDQAMAATLLDTHETLARLSPENLARFRSVVELLRQDFARTTSAP